MLGAQEYPFVIGTAGHIDHGKTTLVMAITGVNCDRLSEEKKRGMTIELGFAPLLLPSGSTVSIVDVPGHEKFIRQMVAGAAGVDAVMLVVAADDGVMPQTKEHLEILSLLGVSDGLTVINKTDLVDDETLELAKDDVSSLVSGTFLENKPMLEVSSVTKKGVPELLQALDALVARGGRKNRKGAFFMPVDRVFHVAGFGTVVTGTAVSGELTEGEDVCILPSGGDAKARSIQVHGEPVKNAVAGQRTALSLSGVSREKIARGDVVAASGFYSPTLCLDALIEVPISNTEPLEHWQRLRLHAGTADVVARIALLDRDRINSGEKAIVQILPEEPIAAYIGAHFILRNYSPLRTVAGGRVLLTLGERPKNKLEKNMLVELLNKLSQEKNERERLLALVEYKGILTFQEAKRLLEIYSAELRGHIASLSAKGEIGVASSGEPVCLSEKKMNAERERFDKLLDIFHREHPERQGMDLEEASRLMGYADKRFAKSLITLFASRGWFSLEEEKIRKNDFAPFDETAFASRVESLREFARKAGYSMPSIDEATDYLKASGKDMNRVIDYLKERREAVIISGEFILFSFVEEEFKQMLSSLEGGITLGAVRDAAGSSRKYILPLLEHLDSKGITRRSGDKRILLRKS